MWWCLLGRKWRKKRCLSCFPFLTSVPNLPEVRTSVVALNKLIGISWMSLLYLISWSWVTVGISLKWDYIQSQSSDFIVPVGLPQHQAGLFFRTIKGHSLSPLTLTLIPAMCVIPTYVCNFFPPLPPFIMLVKGQTCAEYVMCQERSCMLCIW